MVWFKRRVYAFVTVLTCIVVAIWACSSCKYTSTNMDEPPQTVYKQPVPQPLKFTKGKTINWSALKEIRIKPAVEKIDLDKLPAALDDSSGFKPLLKSDNKIKIDFNAIPEKDFDIEKIPSTPLKFKTYILQPPTLVKAGLPHLKNAGELPIYEFGEAQGLRGAAITCVFTDRSGFLWIATNQALYRYDGENLFIYKSVPYSNEIFAMMEDNQGRIWISTLGDGLEILDQTNGTLKITNKSLGLAGDYPTSIFQDKQQRIWVSAFWAGPNYPPGNINIINPNTLSVKLLDKDSWFSRINRMMLDNHQHIWVSTEGQGLSIISPEKKKITFFDKKHGLPTDTVDALLNDHAGKVWIGTRNGEVFALNAAKNQLQVVNEAKHHGNNVQSIQEDDSGRIWFGTQTGGLEIIDLAKLTVLNVNKGQGMDGQEIQSICTDKQGQQWVGTTTGLNMVGCNPIIAGHIGKTVVSCLAEDTRGLIWEGGDFGVSIRNRKNRTIRHLTVQQGLSNDTIQNIAEINGEVFISSQNGLDIVDPATKTMRHLTGKQGLGNSAVTGVIADKAGRLWIGGDKGLDIYDPATGMLKHLGKEQGLKSGIYGTFAEDEQGGIWAGNDAGQITMIDPVTGEVLFLDNADFQKNEFAIMLLSDSENNIWAGTSNGIRIINPKNKTLTHFLAPEGLLGGSITSLLQHQGRIYAATNHGITIITPPAPGVKDGKWRTTSFGSAFGIGRKNEGYSQTDIITRDGLYWWGDEGITVYDLSKTDQSNAAAQITGIKLMDQPVHFINQPQFTIKSGDTLHGRGGTYYIKGQKPTGTGYVNEPNTTWDSVSHSFNVPVNLNLPYNQNFLQFQFANTDLSRRDTAWFRYKLAGIDEHWSEPTYETISRNYYNLSPGKYRFEVSTKNNNATWSKPGIIMVTITPPWWQSWWAFIIYIILLSGTIWGIVHLRSLQLIREKRILEQKVQQRTEEVMQQKEEIEAQRDHLEKAFSDLKTVQSQLIQSEKMASLGELTAGIAHEIQNPLNFVNNFSDVNTELLSELEQEIEKGDLEEIKAIALDIKENEKRINMHGRRAGSIVKGMLEHSRTTAGKKELTNLNTMADEYLRIAYHGLAAKDQAFNAVMITKFDENLPKAEVVPQDIGRVMLNLFNNAFYAVNQKAKTAGADYKPTVSVETFFLPLQGAGGFRVRDNGVGIPDAIKDKIMQPFFTTKPTGEGTGLGLSLTYDMVVKGHGGSISLNTQEGEYSEFIVTIPIT